MDSSLSMTSALLSSASALLQQQALSSEHHELNEFQSRLFELLLELFVHYFELSMLLHSGISEDHFGDHARHLPKLRWICMSIAYCVRSISPRWLIKSQPAFPSIPTFQRPFLVVCSPLQIRNRLLPKAFPTFFLSRKTTAGDFGQKTRGEVRFLYELLPHPSSKRYNKKPSTYSTNPNYLRHLSFLHRHKGYACCAIILKLNWIIATTCNMR